MAVQILQIMDSGFSKGFSYSRAVARVPKLSVGLSFPCVSYVNFDERSDGCASFVYCMRFTADMAAPL